MTGSVPPSRCYEQIANQYEDARGGRRRSGEIADALARWLPPEGSVLDVGAGTGIVADELLQRGWDLTLLDLSPSMLDQAAVRFPGQVIRADAQALPVATARFDAVIFVWSLHHVGDPRRAFREAARALLPGGRIVALAGEPLPRNDDIEPLFQRLLYLRPTHAFSIESIAEQALAAGLRVIARDHTNGAFLDTPRQVVDSIERRLYSSLWEIDEAGWSARVQPVIDALLTLPDPDRPRRRDARHPLIVLETASDR